MNVLCSFLTFYALLCSIVVVHQSDHNRVMVAQVDYHNSYMNPESGFRAGPGHSSSFVNLRPRALRFMYRRTLGRRFTNDEEPFTCIATNTKGAGLEQLRGCLIAATVGVLKNAYQTPRMAPAGALR